MKTAKAMGAILSWGGAEGLCAFSRGELARILHEPRAERAIEQTIARLVRDGAIERVSRDVYVVPLLISGCEHGVLPQIARVAGGANLVVESLESAASQLGIISQVYARGITCVTTGRSRTIDCAYGRVKLVHTSMSPSRLLLCSTLRDGCLLRMTDAATTVCLLRRTGSSRGLEIEWDGEANG